jgi:hypothetical protein
LSSFGDLHIEKFRYPVVVTMIGGERIVGDMFVQSIAPFRTGSEEPPDILNDADGWFPLAAEDGDTLLIAKEHVAEVEAMLPERDDEELLAGARPAVVEVTLANGTIRGGSILLHLHTDRSRLLDFLNRYDERFLTLQSTEGVRLINRRLIASVRPLD